MVIVFDLDDTLYLERNFVRSGFAAVDDWLAAELAIDGFFATAWRLFEAGQRERVFDDALAALGVPVKVGLIGDLVELYRNHRPEIRLAADARRALDRNTSFDGVALLTDGYQSTQERKIEVLGLRSCCDPMITTDRWGREYWKPHPRGFLAIQEHFGRPPPDFVYVADNPAKDFLAPRSLGWKTIRIKRAGGLHAGCVAPASHDADLTIRCLDELDQDDARSLLFERARAATARQRAQPHGIAT